MFVHFRSTDTISAAARTEHNIACVMTVDGTTASIWCRPSLPWQLVGPSHIAQGHERHRVRAVARPAIPRAAKPRTCSTKTVVVAAVSPLASALGIVVIGSAFAVERVGVCHSAETSAFVAHTDNTILPTIFKVSGDGSVKQEAPTPSCRR